MALHKFTDGDAGHEHTEACPCRPGKSEGYATVGTGRNRHPYRGVIFTHGQLPAPAEDDEPAEADCGHIVVDAGGEQQHHEIPDDSAPHAPTTECGCGPQRETRGGHAVIVHVDQDPQHDDEWDGGPQ